MGNLAYANGSSGGDAYAENGYVVISEETSTTSISSSIRGSYSRTTTGNATANNSTVTIKGGNLSNVIYGGYGLSNLGNNHKIEVSGNTVNISGGNVSTIVGGYGENFGTSGESITIENNKITIGGNASVTGLVVGGYFKYKNFNNDESFKGIIKDNTITITGNADLSKADLYGLMIDNIELITEESGNNLIIDNWRGSVNSLNNFNTIKFKNINWENEGIVVNVLNDNAASYLADTQIDLRGSTTLAGGSSLKANDYMYFIKSANGSIETNQNNILVNHEENYDNIFTAGVALQGTGKVEVEEDGSVKYTITSVQNNEQTNIVPINQSLAAAFIISGNDLVVDGLNAMEQDQLFGVKTFAIVEGNDSSYDVAEDIKVNGWNGLYGIGDINELEDGNFSYAVFYENGIANYRTFNRFMDEIIRGDGRVIYNGGGLAGRYRKHNGFYAEASIRAGELRNQMKNMFKDGNGNVYGYNTEGAYYAFHLGTGKIFDIQENQNLDVYCRYYHTYNEGDTFTVAGDRFDVDSITSDKVRIGTRYNINHTENLNTYLGLAFEYEFNGESNVSVNERDLPVEKLQGSSGYAEIGFVQQNGSPWSFEGRARGYVGVREGISGLLRVTYSF